MTTSQPKFWLSPIPEDCNLCDAPIDKQFYDGATPRGWGIFCPSCFLFMGLKLGTGLSQQYTRQPSGRYMKTGG